MYGFTYWNPQKVKLIDRDQVCGCHRQEQGRLGEDAEKEQAFSYEMNKYRVCNV